MKKELILTRNFWTAKGKNFVVEFWGGETATVHLISYPSDALETLVRATRGYAGDYTMDPVTPEEQEKMLAAIPKTALTTQLEMLNFVFLVQDITRSQTHQMVRTRVGASYVQESTRFMGSRDRYKIYVPKSLRIGNTVDEEYVLGVDTALLTYENLVEKQGTVSQDARMLFPHGLLTNIFVSYTLKTLAHVFSQRFCCAAETNWYGLVRQMRALVLKSCGSEIASFISAPIERGENCGYNSSLDRPCTWKARIPEEA